MTKKSRFVMLLACLLSIGALLLAFGCDGGSSSSSSSGGCDTNPTPTPTPAPTPTPGDSACLNGITNYASTGPFRYTTRTSGSVKMWVPGVPSGCKVPVVHLANGTGATCSTYAGILQHLASHGFVAACYESTDTGQGTQAITAVNTAVSQNPNVADGTRLGFTGHSQGGGGAILGVYRAEQTWGTSRYYAGHAIEPASGFGDSPSNWESLYGQIKSPIFMFNGSSDSLVSASWVQDAFDALSNSVEAYYYEAQGASHIPIPTSWASESATAWFRWKLLGDSQACQYFKNMPNSRDWDLQDKKNESACN